VENSARRKSGDVSEDVTAGWTVPKILQLMGADPPNRQNFICCPWHTDKNPSAHVVKDGRGVKCFSCGATGGILDLIVAFNFAEDVKGAAKWLESLHA
jgi:hypothetical protein